MLRVSAVHDIACMHVLEPLPAYSPHEPDRFGLLQGKALSGTITKTFSLLETGVTTDTFTPQQAKIMCVSVLLYAVIQVGRSAVSTIRVCQAHHALLAADGMTCCAPAAGACIHQHQGGRASSLDRRHPVHADAGSLLRLPGPVPRAAAPPGADHDTTMCPAFLPLGEGAMLSCEPETVDTLPSGCLLDDMMSAWPCRWSEHARRGIAWQL